MGAIFAKFRKNKTTYEVLEHLEDEMKIIEAYTASTEARQKRFVGNFLVISIGLYAIGFFIFYFLFFPPTWIDRIIFSTPLLIFPAIIILLKRLVAWYFQQKLNKNSDKLYILREEKKKIIEKVMEKETFKVAVDILNRFTDHSKSEVAIGSARTPTSHYSSSPSLRGVQQRQYLTPSPYNKPMDKTTPQSTSTFLQPNKLSISGVVPTNRNIIKQPTFQSNTPYPIINENAKGILEKMVDFLIGDGPSSRYGMICKECYGHNGMASQEEYEYSAFICAFCKVLNPARKLKPVGPKLNNEIVITNLGTNTKDETSLLSSSDNSDTGSDHDEIEEPQEKGDDELDAPNETVEVREKTQDERKND